MKFIRFLIVIGLIFSFQLSVFAQAEPNDFSSPSSVQMEEKFYKAQVIEVGGIEYKDRFGFEEAYKRIKARLLDPAFGGRQITFDHFVNLKNKGDNAVFETGGLVVLVRSEYNEKVTFEIFEPYRLDALGFLTFLFVALVVIVSRKRGLMALFSLAVSLAILVFFVIPMIVAGNNPIFISFSGAVLIAISTLYLAHGFNKQTTLSLVSTLFTLFLAFALSYLAVRWAGLNGLGSEEALNLTLAGFNVNLRGLLLGAIVIGTLGVLDDVTTTQTAVVHELYKANSEFDFKELYSRGLAVGREHISSMVNTLVLAYVGASFPVFLLITKSSHPFWVILNNEFLAEEIVRTLVGSMTLVLAVPISTILAAKFYSKHRK